MCLKIMHKPIIAALLVIARNWKSNCPLIERVINFGPPIQWNPMSPLKRMKQVYKRANVKRY